MQTLSFLSLCRAFCLTEQDDESRVAASARRQWLQSTISFLLSLFFLVSTVSLPRRALVVVVVCTLHCTLHSLLISCSFPPF